MSSVDLKCPYCGEEHNYDFTEMNEQEEEYELQCPSCEREFSAWNEWYRSVSVLCIKCGRCHCNCEVNK